MPRAVSQILCCTWAKPEPGLGVVCGDLWPQLREGLIERFFGACLGRAEQLFELRPGLLDGVQVRRGGWQGEPFRSGRFDPLAHPWTLCALRLSITTTSPGCNWGPRTWSREARKMSVSVASSMVMAARRPRRLMAPRMVRIFQLPAGVPSPMRAPPRQRAQRRVICVVPPLSSR
jgi:hypothetical protein